MELILLLSLLFTCIIAGVGIFATVCFALGVCYGKYYFDQGEITGERYRPWTRQLFIQRWLSSYLHHSIHFEAKAEDYPQIVIYACHPHGILTASTILTFFGAHRRFRHVRHVIADAVFWIPLLRDIALGLGGIDTSIHAMLHNLSLGHSLVVVPEGVRGMGVPVVAPPKIPGCLRLAWELKIPVVPVYAHGEKELCWVWKHEWPSVTRFRRWIYSLVGITFPTLFFPRLWRRHELKVTLAPPMDPKNFDTVELFADWYQHTIERLCKPSQR